MREGLPEGCRLLMLSEVMEAGARAPKPRMFIAGKDGADADPLISLFYTSGSTGLPKGALYTEQIWKRYWCALALPARTCCNVTPL